MAASAFGAAWTGFEECATPDTTEEFLAAAREMQGAGDLTPRAAVDELPASDIAVPTYIHVVNKSTSPKDGLLTEAEVKANLTDVNQDFAAMGFRFDFQGIDYSTNSTWAMGNDQFAMNCVMRTDMRANSQVTTHEVGHGLGLLHTFQATINTTCDPVNEMIDNMPALVNRWSCNPNDDSCPDLPGKDPFTNYMGLRHLPRRVYARSPDSHGQHAGKIPGQL
ncbi:hypothetical protein PWT90_00678 [Aphanocladium album]|nr:hypothetical protein PWT90_00678 [Aphanocladium album]